MPHSHSPVQLIPALKRMDRHFGGAWSKLDINDRARDWAKHLAAAPIASIEAAVDHLIEHHEGHYPRMAYIRRLAIEDARRHQPHHEDGADSERCPTCGESPGWHPLARRKLPGPMPASWDPDWGVAEVLRLVTRHREDRPCRRFNEAYTFADGTPPEQQEDAA